MKSQHTLKRKLIAASLACSLMLLTLCEAGGAQTMRIRLGKGKKNKEVKPVPVDSTPPEPVTLETVNRRWSGARCQIRIPVEIKKGRDGAGWSDSDWLKAPRLPGEKEIKVRLSVSDREALLRAGHLRRNKELRPGMAFIARDWRFLDPRKQKGIVLHLQFEALPVQARMEFKGAEKLEDLEDVEQLMRIELFQLHEGTQQAAEVEPRIAQAPGVSIVTAAVEPRVATRGTEVEFLITYTVSGGPGTVQVSEKRELRKGDASLAIFNDSKTRVPGTYTSSHKVQISPGTLPGSYMFKASVSMGGNSSEASAKFEVR